MSITIANSVTSIGGFAFSDCENLTSLTLPDSVSVIEWCAFIYCTNLTYMHIPSSVTSISKGVFFSESVFLGCDALAYICSDTADCRAKTYAEAFGIEFRVCTGHAQKTPGDVDGDGQITLKDAALISRYLVGGWNVTVDSDAADVDNDGSVTLKDAALIQRFIVGGWGVVLR